MVKDDYVIFNNKNSLDIVGLYVMNPPAISIPRQKFETFNILGKSGNVKVIQTDEYDQDVYEQIIKNVDFAFLGENFGIFKQYLKGYGDLIFSNQPDRYYKGSVSDIVTLRTTYLEDKKGTFSVFGTKFSCNPFSYLTIGDSAITLTPTSQIWETIILNNHALSFPKMIIYAEGDIGMSVNGLNTYFYNVHGHVEVDSDLKICSKDSVNMGGQMEGLYPCLFEGQNIVKFVGNIKQVQIKPKWREI